VSMLKPARRLYDPPPPGSCEVIVSVCLVTGKPTCATSVCCPSPLPLLLIHSSQSAHPRGHVAAKEEATDATTHPSTIPTQQMHKHARYHRDHRMPQKMVHSTHTDSTHSKRPTEPPTHCINNIGSNTCCRGPPRPIRARRAC
jgi:hypothetical protein